MIFSLSYFFIFLISLINLVATFYGHELFSAYVRAGETLKAKNVLSLVGFLPFS